MTQNQSPESSKEVAGTLRFNLAVVGLLLLNGIIVAVLGRTLIGCAKLLLSEIMIMVSFLCLSVFFHRKRYFEELYRQELLADRARDDAMFELTAVRTRLATVENRLAKSTRPNPTRMNKLLIEHASSAVMMVLQKERGFIQWGLWAAKLGKGAFDYFKSRSDH